MKKTTSLLPFLRLFAVLGMAFLAACSQKHYAPNQLNIPGFREKGEIKAAASHCNGNDYLGFDASAAWAPGNHVEVSGDFLYGAASRNKKPGGWGQGHHANASIGTFWKAGDRGSLEASYGSGLGHVENWTRNADATDFVRTYDFQRSFGQLAYSVRQRNFELSLGTRFVGLRHLHRTDSGVPIPGVIGWNYLFEPGGSVALGGGERFKLTLSFSRSINLNDERVFLSTENFNLGIGAHYRLGRLAKFPEAERKAKAAFDARNDEKTVEIAQERSEITPRRDDSSLDSARVILKRHLKSGSTTDSESNLAAMKKALAAIEKQPDRADVSGLIDIWLLYRPEGFDSKTATEEALFSFPTEAAEAISRKLKSSRYTAFEISELKAFRKRLNASK